jgi:hypothetical protein
VIENLDLSGCGYGVVGKPGLAAHGYGHERRRGWQRLGLQGGDIRPAT